MSSSDAYSYPPPPGFPSTSSIEPSSDPEPSTSTRLPYPPKTAHLTSAPVEILTKDPLLGRGVFATRDIPTGQVVEISPVLVLSEHEYKGSRPREVDAGEQPHHRGDKRDRDGQLLGVEASQLRGYVFTWGKGGDMAVALGLGSLFNHSRTPNVSYEIKLSEYAISYRAAKPIKAGDELCIFYGHSVRFEGDSTEPPADDGQDGAVDDGWGGLGGLDAVEAVTGSEATEDGDRILNDRFAGMSEAEIRERDLEVVGFDDPSFPFRKITEIVDPEDAELSTFPCYAIDLPARHSGIIFQFVRKHTARKFNELQHLKRVRPIKTKEATASDPDLPPPVPIVTSAPRDERASQGDAVPVAPPKREGTQAADAPVSILLFPVWSAPPDLASLLASSALSSAVTPEPIPPIYVVDVPAQAAHTERQADEWNKVWPVTLVHLREGPKAEKKKKGWERGKLEWIERELERVWDDAKRAGQSGEHPVACRITDSWSPSYHSSLLEPAVLASATDTRVSTTNCLSHASSNAIDLVSLVDLTSTRPVLSPDSVVPPYVLTGLTVFISHEPCLMCAMALLHSRINQLYFVRRATDSGGCGSLYRVHEDGGLNHRYEVWEWVGRPGHESDLGKGIESLQVDP